MSPRRTVLALVVTALVGGVLALYYRAHKPVTPGQALAVAQAALNLGVALAVGLAAGGLGRRLLGLGLGADMAAALSPGTAAVLAAALGLGALGLALLVLPRVPAGLNIAAVLLMLMGTQWYLLFNVIAGASAIPQDLRYTTDLLRLSRVERWRTLILPALFPYIVTGGITASGGAWNASIVAEAVQFGGEAHFTTGVGAVIARATSTGNYDQLLAGTLALILTVVFINRTFWRWLYRLAEDRFRME